MIAKTIIPNPAKN